MVWFAMLLACATSGTASFAPSPDDASLNRLSIAGPSGAVITTYDVAIGPSGPEIVGRGTFTLGTFGPSTEDANYFPASGGPYALPRGAHVHLAATPSPAGTVQGASTPDEQRLAGVWVVLDDAAWDDAKLEASAPTLHGRGAEVGAAAN